MSPCVRSRATTLPLAALGVFLAALTLFLSRPALASFASSGISGFGGGVGYTANNYAPFANFGDAYSGHPATFSGNTLDITSDGYGIANSVFYDTPQTITSFKATFTYQLIDYPNDGISPADGVAFVLQNDPRGVNAIGIDGQSLGLADADNGVLQITPSAAVCFNVYQEYNGPGTLFNLNGQDPAAIGYGYTNTVALQDGAPVNVEIDYDGSTMTETLTQVNNGVTGVFSKSWPVNLASVLGATSAYVGFTGAGAAGTSRQRISNFMFTPTSTGVSPRPLITNVSPNNAQVGSGPVTITVTGGGFVPGSKVQWNGATLATTFGNAGVLTATVPASVLARAGSAQVSVANPAPGGGSSGTLPFTIFGAQGSLLISMPLVSYPPGSGQMIPGFSITNSGSVNAAGIHITSAQILYHNGNGTTTTQTSANVTQPAQATVSPGGSTTAAAGFLSPPAGTQVIVRVTFAYNNSSTSATFSTVVPGT